MNAITLLAPAQGAACAPCSHLLPFLSCHSFWKSSGECPWFSWSILGLHCDPLAPDLLPGCSLLKRSGGGISSLGFGVSWSWEQTWNVPGSGDGKAPSPASSTQGSTRKDISQLNPRLPDLGDQRSWGRGGDEFALPVPFQAWEFLRASDKERHRDMNWLVPHPAGKLAAEPGTEQGSLLLGPEDSRKMKIYLF